MKGIIAIGQLLLFMNEGFPNSYAPYAKTVTITRLIIFIYAS